jgi:hypothetical protein
MTTVALFDDNVSCILGAGFKQFGVLAHPMQLENYNSEVYRKGALRILAT